MTTAVIIVVTRSLPNSVGGSGKIGPNLIDTLAAHGQTYLQLHVLAILFSYLSPSTHSTIPIQALLHPSVTCWGDRVFDVMGYYSYLTE